MKQRLPVHLNFVQKTKIGFEIKGNWPIKQLKRLNEVLVYDQDTDPGDIEAELTFGRLGPIPFIDGRIKAKLQLKCQRCMQSMEYIVDTQFKLGIVLNDTQMERLPDEFEPYLLEDDNNHLPDLLEDEVLLALPLVAKHEFDCSEFMQQQDTEQQKPVDKVEQKENPFAALKDLL